MTTAELTVSGHSRRPSGRSPCSALFVAGSLEHRSFGRVIICACIVASTSLPAPERESHSHTTRDDPPSSSSHLAALFERISILYTHHAICIILYIRSREKGCLRLFFIISEYKRRANDVKVFEIIKSTS